MRINELLTESQNLEEGPLLNKIGSGIGKAVGTAAKGVGAVAGGVAGVGKAFKKGFQAGKDVVGQGGDDAEQLYKAANAAPDAGNTAEPAAQQPAAKQAAPAAAQQPAAAPTSTAYAQAKQLIGQLDKKGKQRILAALNKEVGSAPAAPAAQPSATGAMAQQLAGTPNPAVSTSTSATGGTTTKMPGVTKHTANPNNPNAQTAPAAAPAAVAPTAKTKAPAKGIKITGKKAAKPAPTLQAASKENLGNALAESLAQKVEEHKKQMFSEELKTGKTSVFKK